MDREYKREYIEEEAQNPTEIIKIGVFSFVKSSGASFIATSLAKYLSEQRKEPVAFVELKHDARNESLLYEALGMAQRFANREFISFFAAIKEKKHIKRMKNIDSGINWAIRTPKDRERQISLTPMEEIRLLHNVRGNWVVCDLGSLYYEESMAEMDIIIGVIDPLPSNLIASKTNFQKIRLDEQAGRRLCWVINKYNPGINRKLLKRILKIKNPITMPLIPSEWFYVAQYHCRIPFEQYEIKKETLLSIEELVNRHILFT